MDIYDISLTTLQGKTISMADFKGKILLVVNTASKCGFTPQLKGLQTLYETYHDKGFYVLGFPCNQFAGQEPGSKEDIRQGCAINYGVTFPMFQKGHVNGKNTHPLFRFLKEKQSGLVGKAIKVSLPAMPGKQNTSPRFSSASSSSSNITSLNSGLKAPPFPVCQRFALCLSGNFGYGFLSDLSLARIGSHITVYSSLWQPHENGVILWM